VISVERRVAMSQKRLPAEGRGGRESLPKAIGRTAHRAYGYRGDGSSFGRGREDHGGAVQGGRRFEGVGFPGMYGRGTLPSAGFFTAEVWNRGPYTGLSPKSYSSPDERIRESIRGKLTRRPDVDPGQLTVSTENGKVRKLPQWRRKMAMWARLRERPTEKENSMEPLEIHLLEMPRSEAVEAKIRERADRLSRFSDQIQKCQVWVESPHGHHRKGALYGIRIRLTVPEEEIVIVLQPTEEDVYVSIREAFDAARRKLEDYERRRRGEVKAHPRAPGGRDRTRRRQIPARGERA
jgi:ribosome-associated translation inhibitor RaiA